jgi:hypothetical protein
MKKAILLRRSPPKLVISDVHLCLQQRHLVQWQHYMSHDCHCHLRQITIYNIYRLYRIGFFIWEIILKNFSDWLNNTFRLIRRGNFLKQKKNFIVFYFYCVGNFVVSFSLISTVLSFVLTEWKCNINVYKNSLLLTNKRGGNN